ncbi:hypothetical protein GOBAR_AA15489 [Gossypium barbadense]|uniref:Uncharacterized protein n=1 Tax=Gossypium barbadense TaxID=3634 RepID=A0A2P5XP95_GOSBA|nr:hypothetical protein GOBAR_AA15489 [Gossypium barbadense]
MSLSCRLCYSFDPFSFFTEIGSDELPSSYYDNEKIAIYIPNDKSTGERERGYAFNEQFLEMSNAGGIETKGRYLYEDAQRCFSTAGIGTKIKYKVVRLAEVLNKLDTNCLHETKMGIAEE